MSHAADGVRVEDARTHLHYEAKEPEQNAVYFGYCLACGIFSSKPAIPDGCTVEWAKNPADALTVNPFTNHRHNKEAHI